MQNTFYVRATHKFISEDLADKELRVQLKQYGVDARRLSRFTQLSLLGVLALKDKIEQNTSIYLGSGFSSPSKFDKMFHQLMQENVPSPLDFTANLHNAATFQIAQNLGIQGTSIFLAINQHNCLQPLQLALNDLLLDPNQTALVGWAFEAERQHRQEGSMWWLISRQKADAIAEVTIDFTKHEENRPHFLQYFIELECRMSVEKKIIL